MLRPIARLFTIAAFVGAIGVTASSVQAQPQQGSSGGQQQDLPSLLHLRPDQQSSYQAYQAAQQPRPEEISQMRGASPQTLATLTTPQRLDRIGMALHVQQSVFQRRADAARAFYARLSPDQQRAYDQITAPPTQGRPGAQRR